MEDPALTKINNFIEELEELEERKNEKIRIELSNKIRGFTIGCFGENRIKDYEDRMRVDPYDKDGYERDERQIYDIRISRMKNFLLSLKEEHEIKQNLQIQKNPDMEETLEKAEREKGEAQRRKSVAEIKYWGFAIELIESVRKELKEFRNAQNELLKNINELKEEIRNLKK